MMRDNWKLVASLGVIAAPVAVLRYYMKGWAEPLGVPTPVGSSLASLTVVLLVAVFLLFRREGRSAQGRYARAAVPYALLAAWCEALAIAGILATERSGASTYYQGPWEAVRRTFGSATDHAVGHAQGFLPRLGIALIIGGMVYRVSTRGRRTSGSH